MERLLSLFSLYDLLGFILPGGLFAAGTYWAVAGLPHEPGGATTARYGEAAGRLPVGSKFALARAELSAAGRDTRSDLMNARYALTRGLVTATAGLAIVFAVAAATTDDHQRNLIALGVALVAGPVFFNRFRRFGDWFAGQVWQDYAALEARGGSPADSAR